MAARFLLVNCASPYFFYIPMGGFGLCHALKQQGMAAQIFNPALYPEAEVRDRLLAVLAEFAPTHVGFACHWQETVHGLLAALAVVREWNPTVPTLVGGFTASYFAEDLLRTVPELDCVVTGDPEGPVAHLLQGRPPGEIANLVWRGQDGTIRRSDRTWLIGQQQLDRQAFGDCSQLIDAELYIRTIDTKLGFPLLLGRGCAFDCAYCGGSRHAFRLHSGRTQPVTRSIAAILADLHRLKPWTRILYLCYENDQSLVKRLFRAIADDPHLQGHFLLHYGAWHLLDAEFLALYRQAFACTLAPPIIEFSPEVTDDGRRSAIKRGATYGLASLEANIHAIAEAFGGQVRIEVFFSRYHPVFDAAELEREAGAVLLFAHRMARQGVPVQVCSDHLSTDVASRYWEECQDHPRDFANFLARKTLLDEGQLYPFPVDNLCLLMPDHLPAAFLVRHEALLLVLERLERWCREPLHILLACLGDRWLGELAAAIEPWLKERDSQAAFFAEPPLTAVLEALEKRLVAGELPQIPFLADLFRFGRRKLDRSSCPACTPPAPQDIASTWLVLDQERIGIHQQDYLDLPALLQRLDEFGRNPPYRRTVCLFLPSGIVTMPHGLYRDTFRRFEQPLTLADYRKAVGREARIDPEQHDLLLARLLAEGLLIPAPCP
ncbi:MAG: cobalamin-dependent protein [Desulfobulbus sp.]|jgi:hypothetical protein|uniref:cobalamin-dependent protein n=1 Tax=Desulfobulbus sp. TaxID=895 RepID=UPI0028523ADD|nr:cobalamin-dependent protein [Desulfobulbus sp.]MDR2548799.1 cobalamin-dependent protein [Desulfobulbus sp.]